MANNVDGLICRYRKGTESGIGLLGDDGITPLASAASVEDALRRALAGELEPTGAPLARDQVTLEAPIDQHEIWAAGVTYVRSRTARMDESAESGGSWLYEKVYDAERPEIFFKATPSRVAAPDSTVVVRADSDWSVPEPELALWLDADLRLLGLGLGNDMSARDIEGENALYLPQAKVYARAAAVGPGVLPCDDFEAALGHEITLRILRGGSEVFAGSTSTDRLHRKPAELAEWLSRDNLFPTGCVLMTGTGIVPDDDFTLRDGDRIEISSPRLGTLANTVQKGYNRS